MTTSFGADHYVPILKLKPAEAKAMTLLAPGVATGLTPLFEVVDLGDRDDDESEDGEDADVDVDVDASVEKHIDRAIANLADVVATGKVGRFFLDSQALEGEGIDAIRTFVSRAQELDAWCVPVTGIARAEDGSVELAAKTGSGIALRLTRGDLTNGRVKRELLPWVKQHNLSPGSVDLIMDLGAVAEMIEDGVQSEAQRFLDVLPVPREWRTLTLSSVAFSPRGIATDKLVDKDRLDWRVWRDHAHGNRASLPRVPAYSDGGIQHPRGVENIPIEILQNFAPTIRYATGDEWIIIKGVGRKTKPHKYQFPLMAQALIADKRFMGPNHCQGCAGAERAAQGRPRFGSQEVWLRLGAIHHLTLAVEQLRALPVA